VADRSMNVFSFWGKVSAVQKALLITLLGLALRLYFFTGISSADDLSVAGAAFKLMDGGPYLPEGHYDARIGMSYPLAGIFALFGVGDIQMAVIPLLASMAAALLTFLITRKMAGDSAALFAVFAVAIFPLDVFYASQFMPDGLLGVLLAGAMYAAIRAVEAEAHSMRWAALAGLLWGYSYLVKIEAAFLLFPLAVLYLQRRANWAAGFMTAAACALFVVGENLAYYAQSGEVLYRIKAMAGSTQMVTRAEFSGEQLWIFPKAWFLTFYQFSLHYYLLFAGIVWVLVVRQRQLYIVVTWVLVYLLWLQFGANPFAEEFSFKSHLTRYCEMLLVPACILIGAFCNFLMEWRPKLSAAFTAGWSAVSLFLIAFNFLSAERELASKRMLAELGAEITGTIYMDSGSHSLATFYTRKGQVPYSLDLFQKHDFSTGETQVISPADIEGYIFYNRAFVEFRQNRYFMKGLSVDEIDAHCMREKVVSNPAPAVSYASAQALNFIATYIPVAALSEKISHTTSSLLEGDDVLLWKCGGYA